MITVIESKVLLERNKIVLDKGGKTQLPADVVGHSQTLKYISANSKIATVKNGIVTAKNYGETDIKITANGVTAVCHVIVGECEHSYDEGVVTKEPLCDVPGERTYTCIYCEKTYTEEIPWTGHNFSEILSVADPTCTEQGYTLYICHCGEIIERDFTESLGHDWSDWFISKEPTEEEDGEEKRICERCKTEETNIIPKGEHEHNYESVVTYPTCTQEGYTTYYCIGGDSYKDNYTEKTEHSMDSWRVNIAPTTEAEGEKIRNCYNCDYTETLPMEKLVLEGDTIMQKMASRLNSRKENNILEGAMPCRGDVKALVVYVSFPDLEPLSDRSAEDIEKLFFDTNAEEATEYERTSHSLTTFLQNISYGKMNLSGEVFEYTTKKESGSYANDVLVYWEVLDHIFTERNPKDFDSNEDGYIDAVYFLFSNDRSEILPGTHSVSFTYYENDGYKLTEYMASPMGYLVDVGTIAHETIHLFGLPDIYGGVGVNFAGTMADSIMDGASSGVPGIMKFFLGWYDTLIEIDSLKETEVSMKSYSENPELMVIYPNGNKESKFIFLVEYITAEKENANLSYLGEEGGLRIWKVLLNVDDRYGIKNNDISTAGGNSPYLFLEALTKPKDEHYVLRVGESWTPYQKPSSYYGLETEGGASVYLKEKLFSGISITDFTVEEETAVFTVNIEPEAQEKEVQFQYQVVADSLAGKRADGTRELVRIDASVEMKSNAQAEKSYIIYGEERYPLTATETPKGEFVSLVISDDVYKKLAGKENLRLEIAKNSVITYYGVGNEAKTIPVNLIKLTELETAEEKEEYSNLVGEQYLVLPSSVKLSENEVITVVYNTPDLYHFENSIYRMVKYFLDTNSIEEMNLDNSQNGIIKEDMGYTEYRVENTQDGGFRILTRYELQYYEDVYLADGTWCSSKEITGSEFYAEDHSVCMNGENIQKFAWDNNSMVMTEYDPLGNLVSEKTVLKEVPIKEEFQFAIKIQKYGSEHTATFQGVPEDAGINYANSYMYTFDSEGEIKASCRFGDSEGPAYAEVYRLTEKDYVMVGCNFFQHLRMPE